MFVSTRRPPLSTASPSRVRDAKLRSLRGMCDTLEALVESLSVRNRPLILALSRAIAYPVLVLWTHSLAERAHYVTVGGETAFLGQSRAFCDRGNRSLFAKRALLNSSAEETGEDNSWKWFRFPKRAAVLKIE